ncbi:MAG: manganese efflux pump [Bacteroidales bacterium]|nr:manganese efflux pump [Bacteroidales bacterium]
MNTWVSAILLGLSLCADCFAVSHCSSFLMSREELRKKVWTVAAVFAVIQTGLLLGGWALGAFANGLISGYIGHFERIAHMIGFLLLLYVGGAMFLDGVRSKSDHLNLDGFRSILIGGVATSIDAAVVGLSMAMDDAKWTNIAPLALSVLVFTALSVVVGMLSGSFVGRKLGYSARIVGGLVLIGLGINILL